MEMTHINDYPPDSVYIYLNLTTKLNKNFITVKM